MPFSVETDGTERLIGGNSFFSTAVLRSLE